MRYEWNGTGMTDRDASMIIDDAVRIYDNYAKLLDVIHRYIEHRFPYMFFDGFENIAINTGTELIVKGIDFYTNTRHYFTLKFDDAEITLIKHRILD